jgi:hypothetical protein
MAGAEGAGAIAGSNRGTYVVRRQERLGGWWSWLRPYSRPSEMEATRLLPVKVRLDKLQIAPQSRGDAACSKDRTTKEGNMKWEDGNSR